jgi:hypothetical protein
MQVKTTAPTGTITRKVQYGDNTFSLKLKAPSYEDRITDVANEFAAARGVRVAEHVQHRMGFIAGWEDVQGDDGKPIPFTREMLNDAITADPSFAWMVFAELRKHFENRLTDAEVGESNGQ